MSRLVSRILLSILMFPLATIVYLLVFVGGEQMLWRVSFAAGYPMRQVEIFIASGVVTWLFVIAYWCLLWRSGVKWNIKRVIGTILAAGGALGGGFIGGLVAATFDLGGIGFGAFIGGLLSMALWLTATVLIWRETPAERAKRISASGRSTVTCPTCGYNLTGLSESRCPECGSKFTLDELMASQPHSVGEIE